MHSWGVGVATKNRAVPAGGVEGVMPHTLPVEQ